MITTSWNMNICFHLACKCCSIATRKKGGGKSSCRENMGEEQDEAEDHDDDIYELFVKLVLDLIMRSDIV